jgi:hypothetical protein
VPESWQTRSDRRACSSGLQLGLRQQPHVGVDDGGRFGAAQDRLQGRGVEPQIVNGAAVREGMDPGRAVGPAHHHGLAPAVADALQRVGQRLALEAPGVGQHIGDRDRADLRVVEGEFDRRQQHAAVTRLCDAQGGGGRDAAALRQALGQRPVRRRAHPRGLGRQGRLGRLLQLGHPRPLHHGQGRAGGGGVERLAVGPLGLAGGVVLAERRLQHRRALED